MIAVLQRVTQASVSVDGRTVGECGQGLAVLLGVAQGDTENDAEIMAKKILGLRIFCDGAGKMNLSIRDINGEMLVISNFTLLANYRCGNRPDFMNAAPPERANELYEYFKTLVARELKHIGCGVFGAHMNIDIRCDGPVTVVMDSEVLKSKKRGNRNETDN